MDAMAAWLSCLIATLKEQLSCHLVSVTLNRKASSSADRLCEQYLVRRKNSITVNFGSVAESLFQLHLCNSINYNCFRIA